MSPALADKYTVTVTEAIARLGVTQTYLYALLRSRRLDARKVDKEWRINGDSLNNYQRRIIERRSRRGK
jgi:excisionase family DNA binding protein